LPHQTTLIATIAAAFVLAFGLGFVAARLRLPPLVGYLLAGILIGPYTPGFVADSALASQLAEIGVILLMFGVGLHFSVKDLMAVRRIALPGAVAQIVVATLIGAALAHMWGWSLGAGLVFGLSLSVASTVVLLRALEERNSLHTPEGNIAVGWLIVEDLAMVLALVLLPALADSLGGGPPTAAAAAAGGGEGNLFLALALTLAKVVLFVGLALVVGRRVLPWMLMQVARTESRELFTLGVLAVALGIAFGSAALFDVSFALGAFFAGVILSESELSHRAGEDSLPLKDAFAVLFFVSVGMLFDPTILLREPLAVLAVVAVILVGKSLAAFLIVVAFRYPVRTALTVSASLAQIGEFSFILAGLGLSLGLLPEEGQDLILAGALLSITLNPLAFAGIPLIEFGLRSRPRLMSWLEPSAKHSPDAGIALVDHAVIIGHGRVGSVLTPLLANEGLPFVVIERDRHLFDALQARAIPAVFGDAATRDVLEAAQLSRARLLIVALPDGFRARRILELARQLNPHIDTVVRTHSESEFAYLKDQGVGHAVMGEQELARSMADYMLRSFGVPPARAQRLVRGGSDAELAATAERM
jgi:CPA2 family monovalent cation:H+ antiporter-2